MLKKYSRAYAWCSSDIWKHYSDFVFHTNSADNAYFGRHAVASMSLNNRDSGEGFQLENLYGHIANQLRNSHRRS